MSEHSKVGINQKKDFPDGRFSFRRNNYHLTHPQTGIEIIRRLPPETTLDQFIARMLIDIVMYPQVSDPDAKLGIPNPLKRLLTDKEEEAYGLILEGHTNSEIAEAMGIAENTAKKHITGVMKKTGLNSRYKLAEYARRIERIEGFDDDLRLNPPQPKPVQEYVPTVKEQIPYYDLWWYIAKGYSERGIAQKLKLDLTRVRYMTRCLYKKMNIVDVSRLEVRTRSIELYRELYPDLS